MNLAQQGRRKQSTRTKPKVRGLTLLAANRVFAPLLGVWGALLGGLAVMVLPPVLIARSVRGTLLGTWDIPTQPVLAAVAAMVLGGALLALAAEIHRRARRRAGVPSLVERAARRVNPIDPARDLGSRSLDEPIEAMPFATPAWRDADLDVAEPVAASQPAPRALDLAQFAELSGRNAVWVEEVAEADAGHDVGAQPVSPPADLSVAAAPIVSLPRAASPPPPAPEPGTAALARLRAVPPSELSLAEMVERFAGALHEHRATTPARALSEAELAAREAALAEALKALAALSTDTSPQEARQSLKDPLHVAIAQLQARRGVA